MTRIPRPNRVRARAPLRAFCLLALFGAIAGCRGTPEEAPKTLPAESCTCGEAETDALGCPAACCSKPDARCGNALCTCAHEPAGS